MPGSTSTLRTLVQNALLAESGWTLSRYAPELFGRDTNGLVHHSFSVGIPETVPIGDSHQRLADNMYAMSTVRVRWASRLRGDAQSADYGAMLDTEEATVVRRVVAISSANVLVVRLTREARAEGWVLGDATFQVPHRYALA